jgi:ribosomal protein L6P/L9E
MKQIISSNEIDIPKGVVCVIKSRVVKVTGPRGTLERSFGFLKIDLKVQGNKVRAELWFGNKKVRTHTHTHKDENTMHTLTHIHTQTRSHTYLQPHT